MEKVSPTRQHYIKVEQQIRNIAVIILNKSPQELASTSLNKIDFVNESDKKLQFARLLALYASCSCYDPHYKTSHTEKEQIPYEMALSVFSNHMKKDFKQTLALQGYTEKIMDIGMD